MARFDYLLEKIREAPFQEQPFRHLEIAHFFSPADFEAITQAPEVRLPPAADDSALFETLFAHHYKIINFPGCITDKDLYIRWHKHRGAIGQHNNTACEGFGVTLRLVEQQTAVLKELVAFLESDVFNRTLAQKFGLDFSQVYMDCGLQKYLDGYEISPHPDIRKKALTYMVNINPGTDSEKQEHHTHYMRFKESHAYVQEFWRGNPRVDRSWVPWPWCETVKQQRANNSIVIFAPGNDTLHAVKARYEHLPAQRTQLYGNLWYHQVAIDGLINWEELSLDASKFARSKKQTRMADVLPEPIKQFARRWWKQNTTYFSRQHYASQRNKNTPY